MTRFFYYNQVENFGDAINPYLAERVFGLKTCWSAPGSAVLCGVGSILHFFLCRKHKLSGYLSPLFAPPVHVWTSGFVCEPSAKYRLQRRLNVHALRGRLSQAAVERLAGKKADVPLGDGGLLFSRLLEKRPAKRHALGIIPHVADAGNPVFARLQEAVPHAAIIDMRADPLLVLEQIAACDCVVSTAMHGLIAADSLGIPNRWIEVSDKVVGGGFKFRDYYSVFDVPAPTPLRLNDSTPFSRGTVDGIMRDYRVPAKAVESVQNALYNAFPRL